MKAPEKKYPGRFRGHVLAVIKQLMHRPRKIWQIARDTGLSGRTVERIIRDARKAGFDVRQTADHRYYMLVDRPAGEGAITPETPTESDGGET